jgi:hypothetical protein
MRTPTSNVSIAGSSKGPRSLQPLAIYSNTFFGTHFDEQGQLEQKEYRQFLCVY